MRNVLICGAHGGIGQALVDYHLDKGHHVFATYRDLKQAHKEHGLLTPLVYQAEQEESTNKLYTTLSRHIESLDLLINTIGLLQSPSTRVEKSLKQVQQSEFMNSILVNTYPSLALARDLKPLFQNANKAIFASLSAKVGSIGDNGMGGWHSYRISKAALNMAIKNIAIEYGLLNGEKICVAIHPGTTETALSEPFMKVAAAKYKIHSPQESAANIMRVLMGLSKNESGGFFSWDGKVLPY